LSDQEIRNKAEQRELSKGIPINVAPFISQTLGLNLNKPFGSASVSKQSLIKNNFGIKPPLIVNLDDYEISSESDFFDENQDDQLNQIAHDLDLSDMREGPRNANLSSLEIKQGRKVSKKTVQIPKDLLDD